MTDKTVVIKEFKLESLKTDSVVFCIGRRRSGKSYLIRELMYSLHNRGLKNGNIYSGSEDWDPFFRNFFPKLFIKDELREGDMEGLMLRQKKKVKSRQKLTGYGKSIDNNFFLLLDDMQSSDEVWKKSKGFNQIFTMGRHANILLVMALQFVLAVPPALRQNVDYAFLFATEGDTDLKKSYDNFAGVIPNFKLFKDIFYKCTNNHSCLVIDRTIKDGEWFDKVFFYKAKNPGDFKFGSDAMWKFHNENYISEGEEEEEDRLQKTVGLYAKKGIKVTFKSNLN